MFETNTARFEEEVRSKAFGNDSPDEGSTSSILDVKNFSNPYRSQKWVERGETKVPLRKERKKYIFPRKMFWISEKWNLLFLEDGGRGAKYRYQVSQPWRKKGEGGRGWMDSDVNGGPRAREGGRGDDEGVQQTSALSKGCLAVSDLTRRDYRRKRKNAYHLSTTNRTKIGSGLPSSCRTRGENGVGTYTSVCYKRVVTWEGYFFALDNLDNEYSEFVLDSIDF